MPGRCRIGHYAAIGALLHHACDLVECHDLIEPRHREVHELPGVLIIKECSITDDPGQMAGIGLLELGQASACIDLLDVEVRRSRGAGENIIQRVSGVHGDEQELFIGELP